MTADQQRAAADYLQQAYEVSERRASAVLDRCRATVRYERRERPGEAALVRAIRKLAGRHLRWGYKRVHARLVHLGWRVNRKRVRRLWIALGLRRPKPRKKPRKRGVLPGSSGNSCVNQPARHKNDVWTVDFIADRTSDGKALKWLSVVDEYTRECLALKVATTMTGAAVQRILARVVGRRGAPTRLRSDNGAEFVCAALQGWLIGVGTEPLPVAPAHPWENGYVESFHSRVRDEFLNREEFESVADAQSRADWWRREYNRIRPHSGLHYQTPHGFSQACDRKQSAQGDQTEKTGPPGTTRTLITPGLKNG